MTRRGVLVLSGLVYLAVGAAPPAAAAYAAADALQVRLDTGTIRGREQEARAWYGIPYAAAPTGDRRWRAPEPPAAWRGVRDATTPGPVCTQPGRDRAGAAILVGSEDCLTLNVFAPRVGATRARPVLFWIHGGGQMYGTGAQFDGSRLAESQGVVVVTVNYRLGLFGWFHHPAITHAGARPTTGQFALLDLIAALRWVRRNIAAVGGDPRNVTIVGESAGGQNVYALILAPAARGLFHKAIAESGGFWNMSVAQAVNYRDDPVPGTPLSAREVVDALLVAAGKAAAAPAARAAQARTPAADLARWLRGLPPSAVLASYAGAPHADYDLPSVVYDGVLIPRADHRALLARGQYNRVPMIIGGNRDEEKLYLSTDATLLRQVDGHPQIRDPARYAALNRFYSDWWNFMAVDDLAPRLHVPVFAYRFEWDDEPTAPTDLKSLFGAAHGLELAFVFDTFRPSFVLDDLPGDEDGRPGDDPFRLLFTDANRGSRERVSAAMMSYWGAFAHTGNPGAGRRGEQPVWREWRTGGTKQVFGSDGVREAGGSIDGSKLLRDLWSSPDLSADEKCAIFLDATMYPSYELVALAARRCPR